MTLDRELETYILTELAYDVGKNSLDPGDDLLEQGIIDSTALMRLVAFLEEKYAIRVKDEEIVPDNFRSLNQLCRFVERKQATHQESASTLKVDQA